MAGPRVPLATYRVQFNSRFTFADARRIVPYLHRLGISDLYASPIFKARPGSFHGYDITDPTRLNPELGTEQEFDALVEALGAKSVEYPRKMACCGGEYSNVGQPEEAMAMARGKLMELKRLSLDALVVMCPACFMQF
ncbi:MAG: heterodisulfide reductase-related iron-sulfur binding cluster, partial [Dehalococcoidia bacterium]